MTYYTAPGIPKAYHNVKIYDAEHIIKIVSDYYGVDITIDTRKREIVEKRQVAMYLLKKYCRDSDNFSAGLLNRDHATLIASFKTVSGYLEHDKKLDFEIKEMEYLIIK